MEPPMLDRALFAALNDRFTRQLVADDDALLVMFRMLNDAEEKGESALFGQVAPRLAPRLRGLVERHAADEHRHRALTRRALTLLGDRPEVADRRADLVAVMDTELGGLLSGDAARTDDELGRAYLFLHALERRMCAQLGQLARALGPTRPELAAIVEAIRGDELRHVTWCEVVASALLGADPERFQAVRAEMIRLEARVYARVTHRNLLALLDVGLRRMPLGERLAWRAVAWALRVAPGVPVADPTGDIAERRWSGVVVAA